METFNLIYVDFIDEKKTKIFIRLNNLFSKNIFFIKKKKRKNKKFLI
jgi:hypothetical protein